MMNFTKIIKEIEYAYTKLVNRIANSLLTAFEFKDSDKSNKEVGTEYSLNINEIDSIELTNCY